MKSLNEDLQTGQFKQIYLLCGEEAYLKKQYRDKFIRAMLPEGDTMNLSRFEGKGTNLQEVMDVADTLPFFADRRLIIMENTGVFKNAAPELAEKIKNLPDTTYFIFLDEEVDKRGKMYKAVRDKGRIVELNRQDENTLVRWIGAQAEKEQKKMTRSAALYLISKVGNDLENLSRELEKLFCYCMHHTEVTVADIDEICTTQISNHIFDMVEAVGNKEQKKALDYYYELIALKEPPMRILFLLVRQFRILMEVRQMDQARCPQNKIASYVGIPPYFVKKYLAQARNFTGKELRAIVEAGVDLEERVKTGRMNDVLSVELFLVEYSSRKKVDR